MKIALPATALLTLAVLAVWRGRKSDDRVIGPADDVSKTIRSGLEGTHSRCDEAPPSAEDQASWRKTRHRTKLSTVPVTQLVNQADDDLNIEISSRILDESFTAGLGRMTPAERNVYFLDMLEGEVNNGGFQQFFSNSSGNCALQTRAAIAAIGLTDLLPIYDKALAVFPSSAPAEDRATRNDQMESVEDEWTAWSALDSEFYEISTTKRVAAYIRAHAEEFSPPEWYRDERP